MAATRRDGSVSTQVVTQEADLKVPTASVLLSVSQLLHAGLSNELYSEHCCFDCEGTSKVAAAICIHLATDSCCSDAWFLVPSQS